MIRTVVDLWDSSLPPRNRDLLNMPGRLGSILVCLESSRCSQSIGPGRRGNSRFVGMNHRRDSIRYRLGRRLQAC